MPDVAAPSPVAPPAPRWTLTIEPTADGQTAASFVGHVEGVNYAELAHFLAKLLVFYTDQPGRVLASEAQVIAYRARQQLLQDNPATTLYVRDGFSIYVGPLAEEDVARLRAAGWVNGGAVPKGCTESCMFATEREAFEAVCGEPVSAPDAALDAAE